MSAKVFSAAIVGLEATPIEVEVDISGGLALFNIVGLPDKAVEESKERVNAALKNSKAVSPQSKSQRITVNLAPADLKKQGSLYDLPIAVGYLLASKQVSFSSEGKIYCGELSLEGKLRHVNGILAVADMARKKGFGEIYVPIVDAEEAALIHDIKVIPVQSLKELIEHLKGERIIAESTKTDIFKRLSAEKDFDESLDFSYIKGQEHAKRALTIAAAG